MTQQDKLLNFGATGNVSRLCTLGILKGWLCKLCTKAPQKPFIPKLLLFQQLKLPKAGLVHPAASLPHLSLKGSHRKPSCLCTAAGLFVGFTQENLPLKPLKTGCRAGLGARLFSSQPGFCPETPKAPHCAEFPSMSMHHTLLSLSHELRSENISSLPLLITAWRAAAPLQKGAVQGLCLGCRKASSLLLDWNPSGNFGCNFDYSMSVLTMSEPKFQLFFGKHFFHCFPAMTPLFAPF